jgi:hypothetical protein
MKRRFLLLVVGALMMTTTAVAKVHVPLSVSVYADDETPMTHGHPKSPIDPPLLYIEDFTLFFEAYHPDYILNIKDEDGDVVFTTTVYSAQTQVVLPSTFSGDYEVELVMGNWLFTGYINL